MKQRILLTILMCVVSIPGLFAQISNTEINITLSSAAFAPSRVCPWNNIPSSSAGYVYQMYVEFEDGDNFGVWKRLPASGYYNCTVTNTPNAYGPNISIDVPLANFPTVNNTSLMWDLVQTKGTVTLLNTTTNDPTYQIWEYDQYRCPALPIFISSFTYTTFSDRIKFDWTAVDESDYLSHYILQKSYNNFHWVNDVLEPAETGMGNHNYTVYANKPGSNYTWYRLKWIDDNGYARTTTSIQVFNTGSTATSVVCNYANITGPSSSCAPSTAVYKLHNAPASGAIYGWTVTGGSVTSTGQNGLKANIAFSAASNATVYANSANSSCNKSRPVSVGGGEYINFYASNISSNTLYSRYDLTVNMLPGTTGSQYNWYRDGSFFGTGENQSVYLYSPDECAVIEVRITMPCGVVSWNSSMCYMECEGAMEERVKLSPVPANESLIISMMLPPCEEGRIAALRQKTSSGSALYTIQVYDMFGNMKLEHRNVSLKADLRLDVHMLPVGNYILYIRNGKSTITKQIRIAR